MNSAYQDKLRKSVAPATQSRLWRRGLPKSFHYASQAVGTFVPH